MLTAPFESLNKADAAIAGGKGASLGEMTQAGIPVPPGFVVLSDAFERFLQETDLNAEIDSALHAVDHNAIHTVEAASEKIQSLILAAQMPDDLLSEVKDSFNKLNSKYVAVRSSATSEDGAEHAWAGQLDSFLNTTEQNLLDNIKRCWASLFTPRAIFYRFEKGLHAEKISVAVVVQKMVNSEKSGIAFSVHPVTEDRNQIIIEAGFGLGESIVSGQITPDSYVVEKEPRRIIDINVSSQTRGLFRVEGGGNEWKDLGEEGEKQVLLEPEILKLSEIILTIENHYGFPCDIEWAYENNQFYIVQSRPITTLSEKIPGASETVVSDNTTAGLGEGGDKNVGKYILGNQDVDTSFLNLEMTWRGMYEPGIERQIGIPTPPSFEEIIRGTTIKTHMESDSFQGYVNRCAESLLSNPDLLRNLREQTITVTEEIRNLGVQYKDTIGSLSSEEISDLLLKICRLQSKSVELGTVIAFADVYGDITDPLIEIIRKREHLKHPLHVYTHVLGSPGEKSLTECAYLDIAAGGKDDNQLLDEYYWVDQGYIGRGLTKEHLGELKNAYGDKEENLPTFEELIKELRLTPAEERVFEVSRNLIFAKALRADSRQFVHVVVNRIVDRLAEEWGVESRYLETMYTEELVGAMLHGKKGLLSSIGQRWSYCVAIPVKQGEYEILIGDQAKTYVTDKVLVEVVESQTGLKGQIAHPGKVVGRVQLVYGPHHNEKVKEGDILISTATSPQLLPAMKRAAAYVTDVGGITSHAAIVARELGKPCIVGTKIATQVLQDGYLVEVDANKGVVRILGNDSSRVEEIMTTKWHHLGKWIEPALAADTWMKYGEVAQQFFKRKLDRKILYLNGDFFLSQHDSDIFHNEAYEATKNQDRVFFERIYQAVNCVSIDFVESVKHVDSVPDFLDRYQKLTGVWMPLNNIAAGVERYIQETNPEAFSLSAGFIDQKPWTFQQIDEMNELKAGIEKSIGKAIESADEIPERFRGAIKEHLKKYEWVGTHHFAINQLTLENLVERMKSSEKQEHNKKTVEDGDMAYLIWLLDLLGYARFKAAETSGYTTYYLSEHLLSYATTHGLSYDDLLEHTLDEIRAENVSHETAVARRKNTGFYHDGTTEYLLSDNQIKTCLDAITKKDVASTDVIKGLVAYSGKASGVVKIVTHKDQMQDFETGMVLVAYETTPDIIFAMQKCSAVVTDFGGLTSHAAITARELKKPCIVGTKVATKILKDGDLVEVDADNGVVKVVGEEKTNKSSGDSEFIDYSEWEYEFQQRNKHPLLASEMWLRSFNTTFAQEIKLSVPRHIDYIFTSDGKGWIKKEAKRCVIDEIKKQNFGYLDDVSVAVQKRIASLDELKEEILSKHQKASSGELVSLWKQFDQRFIQLIPWYYIPWYISEEEILVHELEKALKPYAEKLATVAPIQEVLGILTFPKKKTAFQQAEHDLSAIVNLAKSHGISSRQVESAISQHADKYGFLATFLFLDILPRSIEEIKKEVSRALALKHGSDKSTNNNSLERRIMNVVGTDQKITELISFVQEYSWLLTSSVEDSFKILADLQPFFRKIAAEMGVTYENFSHHTSAEIIRSLEVDEKVSSEEIAMRKEGTLVKLEDGNLLIIAGPEANKLSEAIEKNIRKSLKTQNSSTVDGKSAFGGQATGVAKICLSAQDTSKLNPGEILVTSMTTPDFVPAMKVASAIITDEGGLLCHAAIISRELSKPCIIGTKIATQVLRDGDLVEVNADNGTVRILNNQIEGEKWHITRTRYIPAIWPIVSYFNWRFKEWLGVNTSGKTVHIFDKGYCTAVWNESLLKTAEEKMAQKLLERPDGLDDLRAQGVRAGEEVVKFVKDFAEHAEKSSVEEFTPFLDELNLQYNQFMRDNMLPWFLSSRPTETTITKELSSYAPEEQKEIFEALSSTESSYSAKEEEEYEDIVEKARQSGVESDQVQKDIRKFVEKYFWFPYEYTGPEVWTLGLVAKRVKESLLASKADRQKKHYDLDAIVRSYGISKSLQDKFKVLRTITLMQDDRKMINSQVCYYVNGVIFEVLADKLSISLEQARYIDQQLLGLYKENPVLCRSKLKERSEYFLLITDGISQLRLEGDAGKQYFAKLEIDLGGSETTDELKGVTANKGVARGKVRVLHHSQVDDFGEGEVIVTGMTTPDFVPLMKKAVAVVTNEGGITSHAAIISRELNIPCIIGTKNATRVLKDGDLVEVDADNGMVRKLD